MSEMLVSTTTEYTVRDQQRMSKARNYFAWQARISAAALGKRVLEVGCGLGNFTEFLLDREWVTGIDIDPECVRLHQQRYSDRENIRSRVLDAQDPAFLELKEQRFDSIACLNVLEHIADDKLTLQQFQKVLPPGGRVVLLVPAFRALYGPIDSGLGHYRRYTKASLKATAEAAGLRAHRLKFVNLVGFFGWWANAKVLKREEQSARQIEIFDSYIVPVMSRLESAVEPPVGQSILAILEKPKAAA